MDNSPFRIVQISDIHLFGEEDQALLGVNTNESFDAVIKLLQADKKPDLIILSGDLSQDGSKASYVRVADKLKGFPVPIYFIPGNHDEIGMLNETYPRDNIICDRQIVLNQWQIILLDSHIEGAVEGFLAASELEFLQNCLRQYPKHHAIIVFHHQPLPVGSAWLDNLGVKNADELWAILSNFPNAKTILFGHVHQVHEGTKNGVRYFSLPSTCIQFKTKSDPFALENLPPGYRSVDLYPDGNLQTGICRVPEYVGEFDVNAKGY